MRDIEIDEDQLVMDSLRVLNHIINQIQSGEEFGVVIGDYCYKIKVVEKIPKDELGELQPIVSGVIDNSEIKH